MFSDNFLKQLESPTKTNTLLIIETRLSYTPQSFSYDDLIKDAVLKNNIGKKKKKNLFIIYLFIFTFFYLVTCPDF